MGSVHVWRLIDNEPKLVILQENILEVKFDYFQLNFIFFSISIIRMILKRLYQLVKMHLFLPMEKAKLKFGMSI